MEGWEQQGLLRLPGKRPMTRWRADHAKGAVPTPQTNPGAPLVGELAAVGSVELAVVQDRDPSRLWNEYVERYHVLGYRQPVGCFLRYFIRSPAGRLGCLLLAGAANALQARDQGIGWSRTRRQQNLPWVINNTRLLIFPWVQLRQLGSQALGQLARRVRAYWRQRWGYEPLLLETFVDPDQFLGTCYRTAGGRELGRTTGRSGLSEHSEVDLCQSAGGGLSRAVVREPLTGKGGAMSPPRPRPSREEIQAQRKARKKAQRELRQRQQAEGLQAPARPGLSNRTCPYPTEEEERAARLEAVSQQVKVYRAMLPVLLKRLSKINDPRHPRKIRRKLTVLMIYGIRCFAFQMSSRREASRVMTRPVFEANLRRLFPDLDALPHNDTLARLLARIEVQEMVQAPLAMIQKLIRGQKFARYLIGGCYPIAIAGSQKFTRAECWEAECLERAVRGKTEAAPDSEPEPDKQYYVYVLGASLAFQNGMVIPLLSEVLSASEGDSQNDKQDCEQKAFHRLAHRLKQCFSHLPILVLLDGLNPNGPIMELCHRNNWDFMIVLQDKSPPSVWEEIKGLKAFQSQNRRSYKWGDRRQQFWWVNDIE